MKQGSSWTTRLACLHNYHTGGIFQSNMLEVIPNKPWIA